MRTVYVAGVGMTRFEKSSRSLKELASDAVTQALADSSATPAGVEAAYVGNAVAGLVTGQEMIRGQVLLRPSGIEAIPIFNIENACASAATAFHMGWQAVAFGIHDVVLCVGAEKLTHEDKSVGLAAIGTAVDVEARAAAAADRTGAAPDALNRSFFMDIYADLTKEYMRRSGATPDQFAKVAVKNQHNGALNPRAQYGGELTVDEILSSREIVWPLTLLMCSPVSDGAAAIVLASRKGRQRLNSPRGPLVRASVVVSGNRHDKDDPSAGSAGRAAALAYDAAGIGPDDLDCVEVHDATAPAELIAYEQLGLASRGQGPELIESGATKLDGRIPVNTSGGLLSKGHPIGATGIAQLCEATWQLRAEAGPRQVEGARTALTHNGGGWLEGDSAAMSVHILSRD
jgi:acetyl-CoA acetyltransferase